MARKKSLTYDTREPQLDVYLYGSLIGHLGRDGGDVWFRYTDEVVVDSNPGRHQLSVRLRVRAETYGPAATRPFFDNLLAESHVRDVLANATKRDAGDLPGLLGRVGGECAGAISVWPHGQDPDPGDYRSLRMEQVFELFSRAHGDQLAKAQLESRQSLSGVQDKLVLRKTAKGYELPLGGAPGNAILKRPSNQFDGLVQNELACLRLVEAVGLPIPATTGLSGTLNLLESMRFDRVGPELRRLHQEDFCQATGRLSIHKYQYNRGPTFGDLATVLGKYTVLPLDDLDRLVRVTLINICIGNFDAHAKNFGILYSETGLKLAPFYDVVSSEVYDFLTPEYAMFIGNARSPSQLDYAALIAFAKMVNWQPKLLLRTLEEIATSVENHWPTVAHSVVGDVGHAPVLDRIEKVIRARIGTLRDAAVGPTAPKAPSELKSL